MSSADKRAIRIDSPTKTRLPLALQLGFLRMTGTTLDACDYVTSSEAYKVGKNQPYLRLPRLFLRWTWMAHRKQSMPQRINWAVPIAKTV